MIQINPDDFGGLFSGVLIYGAMVLAAFWLAMIIWTYRDMRARSRDRLAPLIVAFMVAVLTVPGLLIYFFLRPRETLAEAYERSLEEEALLQEIEDKPVCPGCKQKIKDERRACPNCHTRLKKPCVRCARMLELAWDLCPYCASAQPGYAVERAAPAPDRVATTSSHVRPSAAASTDWQTEQLARTYERRSRSARRSSEPVEFVDGDE